MTERDEKTTDDPKVKTAEDEQVAFYRRLFPGRGLVRFIVGLFGSTAAQRAAGITKPRERLVRHGHGPREVPTVKRILQALWRMIVGSVFYLAPLIGYLIWGRGQSFGEYLTGHLALLVMPVLPLVAAASYSWKNYRRVNPAQPPRGSKRKPKLPKPALPRTRQHTRDINDIIANLDHWPLRLAYLAMMAGAIWVAGNGYPLSVDMLDIAASDPQNLDQPVKSGFWGALVPLVVFGLLRLRTSFVIANRREEIEECYSIAHTTLGYREKLPANPSGRQIAETTPWLAVDVKKWWALYEIDRAFVWAPESLSVSKLDVWDEFSENINIKLPRPEEWRIQRDVKGRGAHIGPANYPRKILWDGECEPNPLTFYIGDDLDDGGKYTLDLESSPHAVMSGPTNTGKTSCAEIVAAQVLKKPMPWDPSLRGQVHVIDPKGPFAQRWCGRPGVIVSNGQQNSAVEPHVYNEDGDIVCENTGVLVMAEHMQHIEDEHRRRADVLAQYPDAGTWMALPDEVKREEKFFPILVISDEFLDHTSGQKGSSIRNEMENVAREFIVSMTDWQLRKARNVGIHYALIAQRANMTRIGDTMMTNMPIRVVTGQIDKPQLETMFGRKPAEIPRLPSHYRDPETGKAKMIPGRARVINAFGQPIAKIQVAWFGGEKNSETLDKWLPRGNKPPNGDFSLPTGTRARAEDDFDSEGNYIGEIDEAAKRPPEDTDGTPTGEPLVSEETSDEVAESTGESSADDSSTESPLEPAAPDTEESPGIFPAAETEDSCDSCDAASSWSCPECQCHYCTDHGKRTRNPDPEAAARFVCGECAARNPYVKVGLAVLLPELTTKVRRYRLHHEYTIREDSDGNEYGELQVRSEEGGKKIVEVFARPDQESPDHGYGYRARSSSGTVEGLTAVQDRIDVAISTYVRKRQEVSAGTGSHTPDEGQ